MKELNDNYVNSVTFILDKLEALNQTLYDSALDGDCEIAVKTINQQKYWLSEMQKNLS